MCDSLTDNYLEALRALHAEVARYMPAMGAFNATPAATENPRAEAVGGGTFEQGDAA